MIYNGFFLGHRGQQFAELGMLKIAGIRHSRFSGNSYYATPEITLYELRKEIQQKAEL